nr:response regulator [Prosthecomicrobium pneumaticum]
MLCLDARFVKPTIVIVEDDKAVRESLRMVLETYGYAVEDFASGEAFLDQQEIGDDRFVVIDAGLPGASGLETLARMRARNGGLETLARMRARNVGLPSVVVSARSDDEMARRARRAGALALLDKPIDIDALLRAIERSAVRGEGVQPRA